MKHFIILFIFLVFFSCKDEEYTEIDVSSVNSLATSEQWAVVNEPYISYLEQPDGSSAVSGYGRIGDVIEVIGITIGEENLLWYKFETGWLSQSSVQIYTNKLQADFAAKETRK